MTLVQEAPSPQFVMASDNVRLATYDVGEPAGPAILAVHGFASSAQVNWFATGWVRELVRSGFRVVAIDLRGHGRSDKPHDPAAYSMQQLVTDVRTVLDTYLLNELGVVGYSLGARIGWHASLGTEHRITRAVLGGIPDGYPLTRFRVEEALDHLVTGAEIEDRITRAYLDMAARTPSNDLRALVALVQGIQGGLQPDPRTPPLQPVLFATGSDDGILPASMRLASATPRGAFFEIPGRNHFNAPTARTFRDRAVSFLQEPDVPRTSATAARASGEISLWEAGLAALLLTSGGAGESSPDIRTLESRLIDRWADWSASVDRIILARTPPGGIVDDQAPLTISSK